MRRGRSPPDNSDKKNSRGFSSALRFGAALRPALLDDGRLTLEVVSVKDRNALTARVVIGGLLSSHKGINLPGVRLRIAGFTEKDESDLAFGISQGVDAVAISFVRTAEDVKEGTLCDGKIFKWQTPAATHRKTGKTRGFGKPRSDPRNCRWCDGGARRPGCGAPARACPRSAKAYYSRCQSSCQTGDHRDANARIHDHKPFAYAREASDVANAVFDGTDAVMLSAETAAGKYPVESVQMMDRIVCEAETHYLEWGMEQHVQGFEHSDAASMARAAQALANDKNVTAVACFTTQGQTAWLMSKIRPRVPIMAFTPDRMTYSRLAFMWGVRPQLVPFVNSLEEMIDHVDNALMRSQVVQLGDQVVLVCGFPVGAVRPPNMALLHTVGE